MHSLNSRRHAFLWCATALLALGACSADRISAPRSLADGRTVALQGRTTLLQATPAGVERRALGAWQAAAVIQNAIARAGDAGRPAVALRLAEAEGSGQALGANGSPSLIRVLAVRDDARRARPGDVFARSWARDGAELTVGVLTGGSGLPETIVFFRDDVPVTLLRYSYIRERGGWRASAAASVTFENGRPVFAIVEQVDGAELSQASFGEEVLAVAGSAVATVRQSVAWKRMADALVPPLHAEEDRCWKERADYMVASAIVVTAAAAVALACGAPTPACAAAVVAYLKAVEAWTAALNRYYQCMGFKIGYDGGGGGGGSGGTIYVAWNIPDQGSIESKIKGVCDSYSCVDQAF